MDSEAVFIGGRSGVGKTSVGFEIHAQLSAAGIRPCLIDGDDLDMAHPPPWEHGLAERHLATMWSNYRELGNRRLIYLNTARREGSERRSVGGRQDVRRQQSTTTPCGSTTR